MKLDLATAIAAAIVGVIIAYVACNLFLPPIEDFSYKTLDAASSSYALTEPNTEVFNFRAVNPTVEVYVGQCKEYNEDGECIDYGSTVEVVVGGDETTDSEDSNSTSNTDKTNGTNSTNTSGTNNANSGTSGTNSTNPTGD